MPVVPFSRLPVGDRSVPRPPPSETFLLMAAAEMHKEGRLVESEYGEPETTRTKPPPAPKAYPPSDGSPGTSMMT